MDIKERYSGSNQMTRKQNESNCIDFNRRKFLKTATVAGIGISGVTAFSESAVAQSCDIVVPDDYSTIQAAVNNAGSGDTVCVKASGGPYTEEVLIDKDLELVGENRPVILSPASLTVRTADNRTGVVFALGDVDVTVRGFKIDGQKNIDGNPDFTGIFYFKASGLIRNNEIVNFQDEPLGGAQKGFGIFVTHKIFTSFDHEVRIDRNTVESYQKNGITANEIGTEAHIVDNTVTGEGDTDAIAQNGIQIGFGATGTIQRNDVSDNAFEDGDSGIGSLVFSADKVTVQDNNFANNETGVAAFGDKNNVKKNDITGKSGWDDVANLSTNGVLVSGDNNKIVNNDIENYEDGVDLEDGDNNKIIRNTFTNVATDIEDGGEDTKVQANR